MIVDVSKKILIVGLGLLGGSYARVLKRFGFHISAITKEQSSIDYALCENIIDEGSTELDERIIGEADLVIFALYPHVFVEWIEQNKVYPQEAIAKGIEGRVIVKFTVEEDGSVTNGKIMKGVDPLLDNEALRLVSIMPKWKPARLDDKDIRTMYNLPLLFKLPKSQD